MYGIFRLHCWKRRAKAIKRISMDSKTDHICVCVCTYKRPNYLKRLLKELQSQKTEERFTFSAVIIDNDSELSAKRIVAGISKEASLQIEYYTEPEKNIALARNKAVQHATGDFIAFMDDDEFPSENWLLRLYKSICEYRVDGILGPVKPYFEPEPPTWVVKSGLCERSSFPTGTMLQNPKYTRTGNVLFDKRIFKENRDWFNRNFGTSGGEDVDFFKRMMAKGYIFNWCNEASVFESVPPERCSRSYFIKRALLRGAINAKNPSVRSIAKSLIASIAYTTGLPVLLFLGQHLFMKYLVKDLDHIGKILGVMGFNAVKERTF